ncbi:SLAIN motif-containing protein 2-like isoform X2 [Physella acuta]|uniref:SLAIN motif-containing protein 2-like isoform X2 n=1 Tax=Physella acuta TaxID=109671 RepID=UPI0027DD7C6F|nr:SLAIN motif-containing protein 2-like isoform X2 [Physella acuta]
MDSTDSLIDPQSEVKKLQELVKKLEKQNEVLRSKQAGVGTQQNGEYDRVNKNNNLNDDEESIDITKVKFKGKLALDDYEDVNFSDLPVEDDSWLYSSPKAVTPQQSKEQIISWVRQDFDHPSPEVQSSRRALISKLDEVARMKHSSSSPVIGSQPYASRSAFALSRSTEEGNNAPPPIRNAVPRKSGLAPPGTFTRPKRVSAPMHGEGDQPQEPITIPSTTDISEIETLAKQQEESLRQSITPANRKAMRAKQALMEGENGTRLSPSRFDLEGAYISQHRGSLGSDHSTPPDSPHNNQHFQLNNVNDSRGRRSLPSTPALQYKSHNSSDSSLERHSVNSDEMNLAPEANRTMSSRLQQPNYRPNANTPKRAISTGLLPGLAQQQQQRGMSPQRTSGLPTPRRQIMRPSSASRSSLPTFRRANAASPKPTNGLEENWRDGCF